MKYDYRSGQVEAAINKMGGMQGFEAFLRDELIIVPKLQINADNGGVTFVPPPLPDPKLFLEDQRRFFKEVYGKHLPKVTLPERQIGFGWGILMAPFMTTQYLFDVSREHFGGAWKWTDQDLDTIIVHNDRDAKRDGAYGIWLRDRVEADEETKNQSARQIISAGMKGTTCAERLGAGLWFHWRTTRQLDIENITLCTGSRNANDNIPNVNWNTDNRKVYVNRYNPDNSNENLRTRVEVSNINLPSGDLC